MSATASARTIALAGAAIAVALVGLVACSDDNEGEGLPDIDEIDLPVGDTIDVGIEGCESEEITIEPGELVVFVAQAPLVRVASEDRSVDTGELLEGEESSVGRDEPFEVEIVCSAGDDAGPVRARNQAQLQWVADE